MIDGGGESGREHCNKRVKYTVDELGKAVAKVAVAQICECEGYHGFQQLALETLSNVAFRYIQNLGKSAKSHADLAGRSECNVFDIVQGLEDFGPVQGFPGASEIDRCPASSGAVKELIQYVSESEEIPFAYDVPQFPVVKDRKLAPSFEQVVGESPGCHIPSWLPAFPYPLTFISPLEKVAQDDKLEQKDAPEHHNKHKEAHPMLNFHQRMSHNVVEGPSSDTFISSVAGRFTEINPFLASPLKYGEVEASSVFCPKNSLDDTIQEKNISENNGHQENHFSEMENPANQLENHLHSSKNDKLTAEEKHRAAVKFSLRVSKKYRITNINGSEEEHCVDDRKSHFAKVEHDDQKDDNKWNSDRNLKVGIENPEEVANDGLGLFC